MPLPELTELHQLLRQKLSPRQEMPTRQREFARVEAYWHIGRLIVETEQDGLARAAYGTELIPLLSRQLIEAYGPGYGVANLWLFRQFFLCFSILDTPYRELNQLQPSLRNDLTWSHYRLLLPLTDERERTFYLHSAADERWSVRTLKALIHSRYYQQVALGEDALLTGERQASPAPAGRRARLARVRQALLTRPGWAVIDRRAADVPLASPKPDLIAYHYRCGALVGVWLLEYTTALAESIRQQLVAWQGTFPPGTIPATGLIVSVNGVVRPVGQLHPTLREVLPTHLP